MPSPGRRAYLDWMRGLAVVIMVGWHTLDSWTLPADKATDAFWYCMLIGGFAAPMFLFSAGISVALAIGSRERKAEAARSTVLGAPCSEQLARSNLLQKVPSAWAAAWPVVKRGGWIWVLAILFRFQSDVLGGRTTLRDILRLDVIRGNTLKVDILNVMGPAISLAAIAIGLTRTLSTRLAACVAGTCAFAFLTPAVRNSTMLAALPDPIEWYFRPWAGRTTFTLFPWAGFVLAGAAIGVLIDRTRERDSERRLIGWLAIAGLLLWLVAGLSTHMPPLLGASDFWRSAPSFFFIRLGVMTAGIAACYAWESRPTAGQRFSPMRQFGVTSLFVYWIHVEMAYGGLSRPIRGQLPLPWAFVAFLLFLAAMLGLSVLKTKIATAWRARKTG